METSKTYRVISGGQMPDTAFYVVTTTTEWGTTAYATKALAEAEIEARKKRDLERGA